MESTLKLESVIETENDVIIREAPAEEDYHPAKRLCIQDPNGKVFFIQIENGATAQLFGLDVVETDVNLSARVEKRRCKMQSKLEVKESVEGYDPTTGEVLGPEGQPVGPGNGSVVIREISSEKEINQAWFTTKEDKSALVDKGINWKQGTWSADEVALLNANILDYCQRRGIEDPVEIIFDMSKDERKDFYRSVSNGLQRPLFSVYRRVIRMYDAKNHIGKYTDDELDRLRQLREEHGSEWAVIGEKMGRSAASVKDRCRLLKDACKSGKWEEDEEDRLIRAVHEVTGTEKGKSVTSNVPWAQIAACVNTRSEKQCRTKWLNYLNWKQAGGDRSWTRTDELMLVSKIARLGCLDESTIDWIALSDGWSAVRSPQWLRSKWWTLKRSLPHYQTLSLSESLKLLLDSQPTGSRFLNRCSSSRGANNRLSTVLPLHGASRTSMPGNDFWGVGEDSNGATSTSDLVNAIPQESTLPTLDRLDVSNVAVRPPSFPIATDLASHLLIDGGPGLHLSSGGVEALHLPSRNFETLQLSGGGLVTSVADVLPTGFPAFASVCVNPLSDDIVDGQRSGLASPSRESTNSRDIVLTRDSLSPLQSSDVATDNLDDRRTFMITPSGHLVPFSATAEVEPLLPTQQQQNVQHEIVISENLASEGLLSDAALLDDEVNGTQFRVECIEDEFIQVGGSAFISDNGYIVIDAGVAATDGDSHFIGVEDGSLDQVESKEMSSFQGNDDRLDEDVFVSTLEPIDAS